MKKTLLTLACSLLLGFSSFGQNKNTDSIINILEGQWKLTSLWGGICGCEILINDTADLKNVHFKKHPTAIDSVGYSYYTDDSTLVAGYSKIGHTAGIGFSGKYFLENWPTGIAGIESKRYFYVSDTLLTIDPEEGISDGQSSIYKRISAGGKYTLQGQIKVSNVVWNTGMIYLYDISIGKTVDSVSFKNGSYLFTSVDTGTYTVSVVPYTDTTLAVVSPNYITTYYVNKVNIQDANTFKITADTYGVDLDLLPATTTASVNILDEFETSVYPNPFTTQLMIKTDQDGVLISVFNIQGNIIYDRVLNQSMSINTSEWTEGVYFVRLQTQSGVNTFTVIK
jgi:hypothetical protein